ncbi:MAG: M6 family metalloprotease domain-containing protein, partial [Candidatus Methylomirabilis sp.]|nr:M6 family metalloprotease domain-containing protein [Deltaproteobacteria bacterium]
NVTGAVTDWATAPQNDAYYEGSAGCNGLDTACGAKTGQLLQATLQAHDAAVNFGLYDNDGPDGLPNSGDDDGYVDFVAFVHPEIGGECGNNNLWSHRWTLTGWGIPSYTTNDARAGGGGIRVLDYVLQPARGCGGGMIEIGVFCHEFGHAFGLPDFYDTDGSSEGAGEWEIMASGSYGGDGNQPEKPAHMSAWSKAFLGWLTPTTIASSQNGVAVPRAETSAFALKIPFAPPVTTLEYFLVENRQKTGFDASLQTGGLLIWHVDDGKKTLIGPNTVNNTECVDNPGACGSAHYLLALEQADGQFDLENNVNRSDAGDPWRAGFATTFSPASLPWSRNYANTANSWPTLSGISASGANMTLNVALPS